MLIARTAVFLLLAAALLPACASAQYRRGSDPGRANFQTATDSRRVPPAVAPSNARFGPRVDGIRSRVLQGPGLQVPFDGSVPGTVADAPVARVGESLASQPAAETLLRSGFRDQGRILSPAAHLQRFPPPPATPVFPYVYTVNFPSRRDGYYAPNLARDQAGQSAYRTPSNRREERNAFQR